MGIKQRKWQEHLKAAETSGMRLSEYAAQHEINVRRLYEERHHAARAKAARARQRRSSFVPIKLRPQALVKVAPAAHHGDGPGVGLAMQARLDNGVVISWTYDATSASAQANLLHTLAGLPCLG